MGDCGAVAATQSFGGCKKVQSFFVQPAAYAHLWVRLMGWPSSSQLQNQSRHFLPRGQVGGTSWPGELGGVEDCEDGDDSAALRAPTKAEET